MQHKQLRIGGASGFWGDSARATSQLLETENLDVIVYDYLAEITMSIMARARAKNQQAGYATDFLTSAMKPNLEEISRQGIKIISNAGGVNPKTCAAELRNIISEMGLDLRVACVRGDDLFDKCDQFVGSNIAEMFSGEPFPPMGDVASINAYLGAFPIAKALDTGADIVVTGRCVDSAVTLGACIHAFKWRREDLNQLAMASLAGHILECGPQATGGNFTDWDQVHDLAQIGYPIVEICDHGGFVCTKPEGSGGIVTVGTIAEQIVYEIGDPQAYILPDVICDFSNVMLEQVSDNRVLVSGALGRPGPPQYKVCATYADGFRGGTIMTFYGIDAAEKAQKLADAVFTGARKSCESMGLSDYSEISTEIIGAESQYGSHAAVVRPREVAIKIAAKHPAAAGIGVLLKEIVGLGLATPPGLSGFQGGRPKPSPIIRLYSFLIPKKLLNICIENDERVFEYFEVLEETCSAEPILRPAPPMQPIDQKTVSLPLVKLAFARSGDKGNKANVGVIARRPEYLPYIYAGLTEKIVADRLAHFLPDQKNREKVAYVERFLMPGSNAINFLIHDVLGGGGVASIRNDPQGKGFSQLLLDIDIPVSKSIFDLAG